MRRRYTILVVVLLLVSLSACAVEETPVPTPTKHPKVTATGEMLCNVECATETFEMTFSPDGSVIEGTIVFDFTQEDMHIEGIVKGRAFSNGKAEGNLFLAVPGEEEFTFPWVGDFGEGVFKGVVTLKGDDIWLDGFLLTY